MPLSNTLQEKHIPSHKQVYFGTPLTTTTTTAPTAPAASTTRTHATLMAAGTNHWIIITVPSPKKCTTHRSSNPNTTSLLSIPTIPLPINIIITPQRFIIIPSSIINRKRQILSPLPYFPRSTVRIPPTLSRNQERPALPSPSLPVTRLDPCLAFYMMYAYCSLVGVVLAHRIGLIGSCKCDE
jgi:hypothetical protein